MTPSGSQATASGRHGALQLIGRALRRRCPNCGTSGIFLSWFRMVPRCPSCELDFERGDEGYIVGAYMFNIIAAELVFAAIFVAVLANSWPEPPWGLLTGVGIAITLVLPVVFYPFSKTLFLAFDLFVNPQESDSG